MKSAFSSILWDQKIIRRLTFPEKVKHCQQQLTSLTNEKRLPLTEIDPFFTFLQFAKQIADGNLPFEVFISLPN